MVCRLLRRETATPGAKLSWGVCRDKEEAFLGLAGWAAALVCVAPTGTDGMQVKQGWRALPSYLQYCQGGGSSTSVTKVILHAFHPQKGQSWDLNP